MEIRFEERGDSDEVIVVDKRLSRLGRKAIQVRPIFVCEHVTKGIICV